MDTRAVDGLEYASGKSPNGWKSIVYNILEIITLGNTPTRRKFLNSLKQLKRLRTEHSKRQARGVRIQFNEGREYRAG